jgi:GNAT superfamily N-acetyltransferase
MLDMLSNPVRQDLDAVRELLREHAATVRHHAGAEAMLADAARLPGPYAPPRGCLYLARLDGSAVGCVALQPLDPTTGEVKRMFVLATARRHGVGRALMQRLLADARALGYRRLRLGTLDEMTAAQRLYQALGFVRIPRYRQDEVDTVFFECDLTAPGRTATDS